MKFVCYTDWEQLPESADAFFKQGEEDSIFYSRAWFECLTTTALSAADSLLLACVVSGDVVLAILPLTQSIGTTNWYSLRHGFTTHYNLLLAEDNHEEVLSCLAKGISQLPVNGLLLEPVANDDTKLLLFQKHLIEAGFNCKTTFRHYNWIYKLHGESYTDYIASRPGQLRNTITRKKRKLERDHGYEIRLFIGADALNAMPDYYAVYNASWKQNEIKNLDFQDCFIEKFSTSGLSRLAILYINDQAVATQLWFVLHKKAYIFRLAYDKAWRQYSTGSILTSFIMEYVIDTDKVNEIDFLTGNDTYKQDWMSERRERFLLSCIREEAPTSRYVRFVNTLKSFVKR